MLNNLLLNPEEFKIDELSEDEGIGVSYCKRLIEKWTPQLESEMPEAKRVNPCMSRKMLMYVSYWCLIVRGKKNMVGLLFL